MMSSPELEKYFGDLSLQDKWVWIKQQMDFISKQEIAFNMRRRFNPHHSPEQAKGETITYRMTQYEKWCEIKDLYAFHRDELANTLENESFEEYKHILERIFTQDLDNALRQTLET